MAYDAAGDTGGGNGGAAGYRELNDPSLQSEDQLRKKINDVYSQELGRDADDEGMNGYLSQVKNGGANIDRDIRAQIRQSAEYKNKGNATGPTSPTSPAAPAAPVQNLTNTGAPPATNTTYDPGRPRVTPTAGTAVGYASNPQLDALMQQMLASEKANQARQDADAKTKADFNMKVRSNIMDQYDKANQPVDPNDPTIAGLRQTHDAASQRALMQGREAMAARGNAEGTPTGASDAQLQSSYENLGRDNAEYGANLQYDELNKRRSMISSLLGQGEGILNPDESRMLSDKLGTMDASMKNLGLKFGAYLGGSQIDNQNSQFYDGMANNDSLQAALMNEMMMREMMGGSGGGVGY